MGWSIGDSTALAAMVRTASRVPVALSVLAANLHRIAAILQKRQRKRQRPVA